MQPALLAWLPVGSGLAPIALARLGAMAVPFSALAQPEVGEAAGARQQGCDASAAILPLFGRKRCTQTFARRPKAVEKSANASSYTGIKCL